MVVGVGDDGGGVATTQTAQGQGVIGADEGWGAVLVGETPPGPSILAGSG